MTTFRLFILLLLVSISHLYSVDSLRLYLQTKPHSLDPRQTNERRTQIILRELFEGLTRMDKEGKPSLALAKEVDVSSDGLQYTFHLRKSCWSNGKEVTAYDFERTWKSILDPNLASPAAHFLFIIKNAQKAHQGECPLDEVAIQAKEAYTLFVTLENPSPFFLELLSNPVFSPLYPKSQDPLVSNGPFILKEHNFQSHVILERNPLYWGDRALVERIHFSIVEDPGTAFFLFQKGELDWYGDPFGIIPIDILSKLLSRLQMRTLSGLYWLVCSQDEDRITPKIRKAITSAVNRDELCRFLNAGEKPCFSIVPDIFHLSSKKHIDENVPSDLKIDPPLIISHWAERSSKTIAQLLQSQLQASLGIKVELAGYDWHTYLKKLYHGDFDLITAAHNPTTQDPIFYFEYINEFFWKEPRFAQLIEKAKSSTASRGVYLQEAEQALQENLPIIPLYSLCFKYAKTAGLQGEVISPVGTIELKWVEWAKTE